MGAGGPEHRCIRRDRPPVVELENADFHERLREPGREARVVERALVAREAPQLVEQLRVDDKLTWVHTALVRQRRVRDARKLTQRMQCWATIESPVLRKIVNQLAPIVPESWITKGYFDFMRHEM